MRVLATGVAPKSPSLALEIETLRLSVDGLSAMLDGVIEGFPDARAEREGIFAASAVAGLIRSRLGLLRDAALGEVNPQLLWSPENDSGGATGIVLRAWDAGERGRHAREELARAERAGRTTKARSRR